MIGTSGAMRVAFTGEPPMKIPSGLWCYRIGQKRVVMGGALSDGGGVYRWLKQNLKLPKDAESQIANRPPGARGLTFMPFLSGERSTGYDEDRSGSILGLTSGHNSVDILQAAMESVAFRFAEILEQISSVVQVKEIVASGGALRDSPIWAQIIADVLGRDLIINGAGESSLRGAVLGVLPHLRMPQISGLLIKRSTVVHSPKKTLLYEEIRKIHRKCYYADIGKN